MSSNNEDFIWNPHGSGANVGNDDDHIDGGGNVLGSDSEDTFEHDSPLDLP